MSGRSNLWHFRMPGMAYSGDLRFYSEVSEKEARAELRERGDMTRLPNGTEFWV